MITRANMNQSGWNDNCNITVAYWTCCHGGGRRGQGGQIGRGIGKNNF